jgi:hypothetical protein
MGLATDLTKHRDEDAKGMCGVHTLGGEQNYAASQETADT